MLAVWPATLAQAQAPLTLADAMARAVRTQPALEANQLEVAARAAEMAQAARWLNPTAAVELEDLGRSTRSAGPSQTTVSVHQRLELGGKRARRVAAAAVEHTVAERDLLVVRHDLEGRVASAFIRVLTAQARVELAEQDATTAVETAAAIAARVDAGAAPPPDGDRAQAASLAAGIRLRTTRRELDAARVDLASSWAGPPEDAAAVTGTLGMPAIPTIEALQTAVDTSPAVQRGQADVARARSSADTTRAARTPDLDVTVGYRRLHDLPSRSWLIGAGVSVPLFDRQRDRLTAASLRVESAGRALEANRVSARTIVVMAHRVALDAAASVEAFDTELIPLHDRVFAAVSEGYAAGRFGLLQLLDARQSLIDARRVRLSALEELFQALVTMHSTLGRTDDLAALTAAGSSR